MDVCVGAASWLATVRLTLHYLCQLDSHRTSGMRRFVLAPLFKMCPVGGSRRFRNDCQVIINYKYLKLKLEPLLGEQARTIRASPATFPAPPLP